MLAQSPSNPTLPASFIEDIIEHAATDCDVIVMVYLGLGSNEGERELLISRAVQLLRDHPNIRVAQLSFLREYDAVGGPPQGPYLNAVVAIETTLAPETLLAQCQHIERALGRRPSTVRWGPRPIDLDILLYGDQMIHWPSLMVPHPRLHERRFVLEPLVELAPDLIHPVLRRTMRELYDTLCASSAHPAA